jgi:PHD-finger
VGLFRSNWGDGLLSICQNAGPVPTRACLSVRPSVHSPALSVRPSVRLCGQPPPRARAGKSKAKARWVVASDDEAEDVDEDKEQDADDEEEEEEEEEEESDEDGDGSHAYCGTCGDGGDEGKMLLCDGDGCEAGYHTYCLTPKLEVTGPDALFFWSIDQVLRVTVSGAALY